MSRSIRIEPRLAIAGAVALLFAVLVMLGPGAERSEAAQCKNSSVPAYKLSGDEARRATLCLLNKERRSHGLKRLRAHKDQQQAAGGHNRVMIKKRCFAHQCSGERDLVGRLEAAGYLGCSCAYSVGENIAWGSGGSATPRSIVKSWMNSAGHRANILNGKFEHIGVAVHDGSPAGGGGSATFTTDFGYKD